MEKYGKIVAAKSPVRVKDVADAIADGLGKGLKFGPWQNQKMHTIPRIEQFDSLIWGGKGGKARDNHTTERY